MVMKQSKLQVRKKYTIIGLAIIVAASLTIGGMYIQRNKKTSAQSDTATGVSPEQADAIFRRYLVKSASSNGYFTNEELSGSGAKLTGTASFDASKKQILREEELHCSAKIDNSEVSLDVSLQVQNATTYYRLNEMDGIVTGADGQTRNFHDVYANIKGVWYKDPQPDMVAQDQIDNGVFVFNSEVVAPGYDAQQIANFFINNRAYTYTQVKKQDGNYVYSFRAIQTNFSENMLKQLFPGLKAPNDILGQIFSEKSTLDSTLTIAEDGTLVKEESTGKNYCKDVLAIFTGVSQENLPSPNVLTGSATPVQAKDIQITPITNARSAEDMAKDLAAPQRQSI